MRKGSPNFNRHEQRVLKGLLCESGRDGVGMRQEFPPRRAFRGAPGRLRREASNADISGVRQNCAQCLTEVLAGGYDTPTGETLCGPCYFALWGPRANGDRLASTTERRRPRSRRPAKPKTHWIGPTFDVKGP